VEKVAYQAHPLRHLPLIWLTEFASLGDHPAKTPTRKTLGGPVSQDGAFKTALCGCQTLGKVEAGRGIVARVFKVTDVSLQVSWPPASS
jgi:hypothetical protein